MALPVAVGAVARQEPAAAPARAAAGWLALPAPALAPSAPWASYPLPGPLVAAAGEEEGAEEAAVALALALGYAARAAFQPTALPAQMAQASAQYAEQLVAQAASAVLATPVAASAL